MGALVSKFSKPRQQLPWARAKGSHPEAFCGQGPARRGSAGGHCQVPFPGGEQSSPGLMRRGRGARRAASCACRRRLACMPPAIPHDSLRFLASACDVLRSWASQALFQVDTRLTADQGCTFGCHKHHASVLLYPYLPGNLPLRGKLPGSSWGSPWGLSGRSRPHWGGEGPIASGKLLLAITRK